MKYFSGLLFLVVISYVLWPYVQLYQLARAVDSQDQQALADMLDLESIRKTHKENLKWQLNNTINLEGENRLSSIMRKGANALGDAAVNTVVDIEWINQQLQQIDTSFWQQVSFAFFESPTRFTIRVGELGHDPVHIQMKLQDWFWRVNGIYP